MSSNTSKQLLFPDVTEVDVDVFANAQTDFAILQQFGFYVSTVNDVSSNFYQVGVTLDPSANNLVASGTPEADETTIFNALKTVNIGYLNDSVPSVDPDVIETDSWVQSGLTADAINVTEQPAAGAGHTVGSMILNGVIGPMFTGVWGSSAIEKSNRDALVDATGTYDASGIALDHKIAKGLHDTLEAASLDAHDEVLSHLLDQLIDDNAGITNQQQALQYSDASGGLGLNADGIVESVYANQDFWMKVYLDMNMNKTDAASDYITLSADYQHDISGSAFDSNNVLNTDDDDGSLANDGKANLVTKTLEQAMTVADLNDTFLSVFKGEIIVQAQSVYGTFDGATETADYSEGQSINNTSYAIKTVRVPLLVRMNVGA